ncbi:MAG TPA: methylmalonyl-CoA mutase family protein, partial [Streptomyces sp.]|nr:methylmalonyl-CoA mutase family protein [Streptomyces sp.]
MQGAAQRQGAVPDFSDIALDGTGELDGQTGPGGRAEPETAELPHEAWQSAVQESTGKGDADLVWETPEGVAVKPLYTSHDVAGLDFLQTYPGVAPYLRGPYPTMYVNQPWTIRQYAGFSTAEESNA